MTLVHLHAVADKTCMLTSRVLAPHRAVASGSLCFSIDFYLKDSSRLSRDEQLDCTPIAFHSHPLHCAALKSEPTIGTRMKAS